MRKCELPLAHQLELIINDLTTALNTADNMDLTKIGDKLDSLQEDLQAIQEDLPEGI